MEITKDEFKKLVKSTLIQTNSFTSKSKSIYGNTYYTGDTIYLVSVQGEPSFDNPSENLEVTVRVVTVIEYEIEKFVNEYKMISNLDDEAIKTFSKKI